MDKYREFADRQTSDYLIELCYWAHDRAEYARKCKCKPDPEDILYQYAAEDELTRRGLAFPVFFVAAAI